MPIRLTAAAAQALTAYNSDLRPDDPERLDGIRGPYEILHQRKFGTLPEGGWRLRPGESRVGVLWQVLSGALDPYPDFAAAYLALALDKGLDDEGYAHELRALHRQWGDYLDRNAFTSDHHHGAMRGTFARVSCPQCSMLTALACVDADMNDLFVRDLLPLKSPQDRHAFLAEKGLVAMLDTMLPHAAPV